LAEAQCSEQLERTKTAKASQSWLSWGGSLIFGSSDQEQQNDGTQKLKNISNFRKLSYLPIYSVDELDFELTPAQRQFFYRAIDYDEESDKQQQKAIAAVDVPKEVRQFYARVRQQIH
jgi:hypothetical protein